jgi:outer membrane protein TolC
LPTLKPANAARPQLQSPPFRGVLAACVLLLGAAPPANAEGLSLDRAVAIAIERNEVVLAAMERSDAARARVGRARGAFLPSFSLEGDYTRRGEESVRQVGDEEVTIQSRDAFGGQAILRQPLFDARLIPLYRAARLERDAARYGAFDIQRRIGFSAADAFLVALSRDQVLQAAERRLELAASTVADARARFAAQIASSNDVTRTELELASAERELALARGEQESAYLELESIMNAPIDPPLVPPDYLLAAAAEPPGEMVELVATAQLRRLDVGADRLSARAARAAAQEPLMRLVPRFDLHGELDQTTVGGLSGQETDWFGRVELTWPLFDGGQREAERAERSALADAADYEVRALERQIELEVRTALVTLASEQASSRQAQAAADVGRRNAREATELYRQGLASALEAADANQRLFEAEVALARAGYGVTQAWLGLRAALGLDALGQEPAK